MNISSNFIAHYSMFNCHLGGLQSAISAFPLLVGDDGFVKMPLFKVRPQGLGHPNLGISDLPQEKITDSQFAAGSNQQIGIRLAGSVKILSEIDRKSTRLNSSHRCISYAVFCLKKK